MMCRMQPIVSREGSVLFSKPLLTAREHFVIQSVYVFFSTHIHTHTPHLAKGEMAVQGVQFA